LPSPAPPLALSSAERSVILELLTSARFAECTPYTAFARLLDEGRYLASVRTMYRVLGNIMSTDGIGLDSSWLLVLIFKSIFA
jgi:hypothetical protein